MALPVAGTAKMPNPWWVGIVSGMASYIDAAAIVSNGIALVIYQDSIGLSGSEFGWLSGVLTFCIAIGALVGGRLGDAIGRRTVFTATMAMIAVGSGMMVFGTAFPILLTGVVLVGLGTGADLPVSLATISEAATDKNRGALLGLSNLLWGIGILATTLIASFASHLGRLGGQIMYGHIVVVALLLLLLRLGIPESPYWLKARDERRRGIATNRAERVHFAELFKTPYAKPFIALLVFYCLTNLAASTGGMFGTYIAVNVVGISVELNSRLGLLTFPLGLIGGALFMKLVGTRHRMTLFGIGAVLFVSAYAIPAVFGFSLTTLVLTMTLSIAGGSLAFEGIMKVWTQESFPTMLRSTAQGTIIAASRVFAATLAIFTPALVEYNPRLTYTGLFLTVAVGLGVAWLTFRNQARNEFDTEGETDADRAADPDRADRPVSPPYV
ncbi:MFS transporter [Streptomyces sp. NPDC032161]|uniref:MFS transporter n=1 Tax=unclassified Streptomyces TaxID=2593676 RepID=UPI0033C3F498